MAGAGYKLFATGDVLTAAQVNTYLMEQTVMRFADSAARTTALSGVLAEGMVSYLQDTNTLEVYDGAAWVGATGDITGLTAGTGISISSATGPVPTVTNSMATEITAKGDLIVGTGSATFDNLAAGSNGETLVADSSAAVGLRYSATPSASNPVLNSAMQIWQRGTSGIAATSTGAYFADRWQIGRGVAGATGSRQTTNDSTNLPFIQYCARVQRDSGNTSTSNIFLAQSMESVNSIPYAGKTITMSFYARAGANYSATSNALQAVLQTGTGTDQNVLTGYAGTAYPINSAVTLTTTWQRFTITGTLASTTTEMGMYFQFTPTGTAGANDWFEVTGVQIDIGSVALPFRTYAATIQGELAACQRYYWRFGGDSNYQQFYQGTFSSTTNARVQIYNPVPMRTKIASIEYANIYITDGGNNFAPSAASIDQAGIMTSAINFTVTSATQYRVAQMYANNTTAAYIAASAELQEIIMDNVTFIEVEGVEHAIIDRGNGEFTSMPKSEYDRQQAEQSTPSVTSGDQL